MIDQGLGSQEWWKFVRNLKHTGLWTIPWKAGCLAVRKGWVLVAKGGNSPRQLCKIYWLSAVPPACNFYLERSPDIANYALGRLTISHQTTFYVTFSRNIFLMSLFKLFHFMDLTKVFLAKTPIFIWSPSPRVWQAAGLQNIWAFPDSFLGHCFMRQLK